MTPPLEPTVEPRVSYSVSKKKLTYSLTNSDISLTNNLFAVIIYRMVWLSSIFGQSGRRPSSTGHVPCGTRSCICAHFRTHVNFYDHSHNRKVSHAYNIRADKHTSSTWNVSAG